MRDKGLIFALDAESLNQALSWVEKLRKYVDGFKIGAQFFTRTGLSAIKLIHEAQSRVFLDLKFHDIPFTVEESAYETARMGVWMFNVHALGGKEMMRRAMIGAERGAKEIKKPKPKVLAVTILTSISDQDLKELGFFQTAQSLTLHLAKLALEVGMDGVVASPQDVRVLRKKLGTKFLIITPGIRFEKKLIEDDQKRIATPKEAISAGANYLVVGRPIRDSLDPVRTAKEIIQEIASVRKNE